MPVAEVRVGGGRLVDIFRGRHEFQYQNNIKHTYSIGITCVNELGILFICLFVSTFRSVFYLKHNHFYNIVAPPPLFPYITMSECVLVVIDIHIRFEFIPFGWG